MRGIVLVAGATMWLLSEIFELLQGGFTLLNSTISVGAFAIIAIGIWSLWKYVAGNRLAKAGVVLLSLGMAAFAVVSVQALLSGAQNDTELSGAALFLFAGAAVSTGVLLLSYWFMTSPPFPATIGVILLLATVFSLSVAYLPSMVGLQPLSNLVLATIIGWLGLRCERIEKGN